MRIVVTGASGFVGREMLRRTALSGHHTVPLVRHSAGIEEEVIVGDLAEVDPIVINRAMEGADAVVHLAARTHVMRDAPDATEAFRRANVLATEKVLRAANQSAVGRFVFMSSIKVNGEETQPGERFSGEDVPKPEDDYGRTKLEAERLVTNAALSSQTEVVILRPPLVYGPSVGGNFGRLVAAVRRGVPLPFGAIDNLRSLISVRNLAEATLRAVEAPVQGATVVTLCDGEDVSTRGLVLSIGKAIGRPAHLLPIPPSLMHIAGRLTGRSSEARRLLNNLQVDTSAACKLLSWKPSEQLDAALTRMFRQGNEGAQ
ncbi:NAD-dependent epimerase/dehydratase family protein [Altererythrobacter sp. SALINAS58]|uniref:NAD-dependent epimerase/dehydratase family protein n=1 Tax=Alteripontixanthobacter muriae TaxID=2705546 RepID=UPI0015771976|nr:NAD-dependent epimerase/dehydratase family protein [Alteripontixanthobacter muriae]NTZ43418.1 NAD-dependent epimerase/dehydratase family protein [Alteripontixanthobacter muriae]